MIITRPLSVCLSWRRACRACLSLWASWCSTAWTDCASSTEACRDSAGLWRHSPSAPPVIIFKGILQPKWSFTFFFWSPQHLLFSPSLILRPEGERLVLCAEHMQRLILAGWTVLVAGSAASVQEAQGTRAHGNFHPDSAESAKVSIPFYFILFEFFI